MEIAASNISMLSSRSYFEQREVNENLKVWIGSERPDFEGQNRQIAQAPDARDYVVELTGKGHGNKPVQPALTDELSKTSDSIEPNGKEELKIIIVEKVVEVLTGKKIKIKPIDVQQDCKDGKCSDPRDESAGANAEVKPQEARQKQGWGLEYDYHEKHSEEEKVKFNAEGVVRTADGKQIKFAIEISMNRTFVEENNVSVRAGDAVKVDPLVINFGGSAIELTGTKFNFDLNIDGNPETIPFAGPNSGLLAIDKNNDGKINDGSELFGPASGDGFAELAKYDEDGNMWIDEKDSVFAKLLVWSKDNQENDQLMTLKQKGIGAVYLGNAGTQFSIKDSANGLQGQVNNTGIYLNENGTAGTVQQIDLAV